MDWFRLFITWSGLNLKKAFRKRQNLLMRTRNGTILGAGATSLIIERTDKIKVRGMNGQAEILGTRIGNSAFHTTGIDVKHLAGEMVAFVNQFEKRHNLEKSKYVEKTVSCHTRLSLLREIEVQTLKSKHCGHLTEILPKK